MRYTEFGPEKTKVSSVMLGLMRVDGMDAKTLSHLLHTALDLGINSIDTADIYAGSDSERLLGEVFAKEPGLRDQFFLQTKVGIHRDNGITYFDFSKQYLKDAAHASLERLGVDQVDALLLHRPDVLMDAAEVSEALSELHSEGLVKDFGVSNENPATMRRLQAACSFPLVANQVQLSVAFAPAFEAVLNANMECGNAFMRDGGIFEYALAHDQVIQTWSSLQYGYFEGTFLNNPKFPKLNEVLSRIADEHSVTPSAVAIAWNLRYPAKMQAIVGTTNEQHLTELAKGANIKLTRREWYELYLAAGRQLP
ncbi:MAG: aldo/keto reductase family oxidoreductase [Atopobiaceae bacterium]